MMTTSNSWWRSDVFWNQALAMLVSLYVLGLFIPDFPKLENGALYGAVVICLFGGRWKAGLQSLLHPLFLLLLAFLGWLLLTSVISDEPTIALHDYRRAFKDYFLIFLPLMFVLADASGRQLMGRLLAYAGLVIVLLNTAQYVQEWWTDSAALMDIKAHRGWGHPLVLLLPFALMQMRLSERRAFWAWLALALVEGAMIIATGARGAWLAMFAVLAVWAIAGFTRKQFVAVGVSTLALVLVAYFALPAFLLRDRVEQGFDTSLRTTGTWGPAIEMMDERPLLGYGFGKEAFSREFNRRAPERDSWTIKKSKGPHSIYLEAGFAGGYPALVAITLLFGAILFYGYRAIRHLRITDSRLLALAATSSFIGFYITRGALETVRWSPLIILIGIIIHLSSRPATAR